MLSNAILRAQHMRLYRQWERGGAPWQWAIKRGATAKGNSFEVLRG